MANESIYSTYENIPPTSNTFSKRKRFKLRQLIQLFQSARMTGHFAKKRMISMKCGHLMVTKRFQISNDIVICQRIVRQRLHKHPAICARNNRTNIYVSLLRNRQHANELDRYLSRDLFSVWFALRNNRIVFSVRGPCREDMREYGNGN
jgi:hypothetical protein